MKKKIISSLILLVLLFIGASSCYAETYPSERNESGIFHYATIDGKATIINFIHEDGVATVKIPDKVGYEGQIPVVAINAGAFNNVEGMMSIWIPASVKNIDCQAFLNCSDLSLVSIGTGYDSSTGQMNCNIDSAAFRGCNNIEEIFILQDIPAFSVENSTYSLQELGLSNLKKIHAHKGSWAEGYAQKNNLKFRPVINFEDVNYTSWYYEAVRFAFNNQIIKGVDSTHFAPTQKLTRGMIATILWRMEGSPENDGNSKFTDVDSSVWYAQAIKWASDNKIANGYSGTTNFGPKDFITRQDLAVILRNYSNYRGNNVNVTEDLSSFKDYKQVSNYAKDAMQWAVAKGVVTGNAKTKTLNPRGNATRAEAASMIVKYCDKFGRYK